MIGGVIAILSSIVAALLLLLQGSRNKTKQLEAEQVTAKIGWDEAMAAARTEKLRQTYEEALKSLPDMSGIKWDDNLKKSINTPGLVDALEDMRKRGD